MKKFQESLRSLGITLLVFSVTVLAACASGGPGYGGVGY
jgi:hypothetical protein